MFPDRRWGPFQLITLEVTGANSRGISRLVREADHSRPHCVPRLRISGAILPLPFIPYGVHRGNFILSCTKEGAGRNGLSVVTLKILIPEYLI